MPLHKELLCSAKHTVSLPSTEVKSRPWEHRLVDESCGSDVQVLLQKGKEWETKYMRSLPKPGILGCINTHVYTVKRVFFGGENFS